MFCTFVGRYYHQFIIHRAIVNENTKDFLTVKRSNMQPGNHVLNDDEGNFEGDLHITKNQDESDIYLRGVLIACCRLKIQGLLREEFSERIIQDDLNA